ncbi:MAG: hypothetical protein KatS3mg081_2116 [Gemmatimonadales bacterium]|nr:MAG: hypothetical protein KatS3mg081_2116 [Gemmatimonadales bacterium]
MKTAVMLALLMLPVAGLESQELGTVHFPTTAGPEAQAHFLRGLALLHSFEYDRAAREFREAQRIEPGFAMAYWGEALTYTHPIWNQQDRDAARAVLGRLGDTRAARLSRAADARERAYLEAVEILYGDGPKARRDTLYAKRHGTDRARVPGRSRGQSAIRSRPVGTGPRSA